MRKGLDELQERPEERRGIGADPADKTIHQPVLQHHAGKVIRGDEQIAQIPPGHSLVPFEKRGHLEKARHFRRSLRINNGNLLQRDVIGGRHLLDLVTFADEDRHSEAPVIEHTGCPYHTGIITIGKNDPLGVATEFCVNGFEKRHLPVRLEKIRLIDKDVPNALLPQMQLLPSSLIFS
jgi:hypothetical protein